MSNTDPTKPDAPLGILDREPLAVRAAVTAAATAVVHVAFVILGDAGSDTELAIGSAIDAAGLVALLLWTRPRVVPAAKVIARVTSRGRVVAGEAAEQPTETVLAVDPPYTDEQGRPDVTVRPELLADPHGHPLEDPPAPPRPRLSDPGRPPEIPGIH